MLEQADIAELVRSELSEGLLGKVLTAGDEGYDEARRLWNGMIDRRPRHIVRCAVPGDVIKAVNFGRDHSLAISLRGGGHNVSGNAVSDGGLMVDLSALKGIRVDPARATARAGAGCLWREFDHETQSFGLATTGGVIPSTGIAGLTLGGGFGWLMRKHGLSCDNLISADIVTAGGRLIKASSDENPDLFWALRGGGGNFGVVTSFKYRLHPVGHVLAGMAAHRLDNAKPALQFLRDFWQGAPDHFMSMPAFVTGPDGEKLLAMLLCWSGPLAEGEKALEPLRRIGPPVADTIAAIPYVQMQNSLEGGFPHGQRNYWKSSFLRGLSDEAIDLLVDGFRQAPSPACAIAIEQLGGAMGRIGETDTAFPHRREVGNLLILGMWPDAAGDDANIAWVRRLWTAMQPHAAVGVYVNYLGQTSEEGEARVRAAYGGKTYTRLAEIKRKYDPDNLFRLNQNIIPAK
jgi:FAD/FMN-containing dehydrogenase